jgi:hypothetical protein
LDYSKLYTNLKNVLSFYGGMFGVRSVLWHQGEAETKTLLNIYKNGSYNNAGTKPSPYNITDYSIKLKNIIDNSRLILTNLKWAISQSSLISEFPSGAIGSNLHFNIINTSDNITTTATNHRIGSSPIITNQAMSNLTVTGSVIDQQYKLQTQNSSYISWFTKSDGLAYTQNISTNMRNGTFNDAGNMDATHFSEKGLSAMVTDANSNIISSVLTKGAVAPTSIPKVVLTKVSTGLYTASVTAPAGVSYVHSQWSGYESTKYNQANGTNQVNTFQISTSAPYVNSCTGYMKDANGRISIIPLAHISVQGARIASSLESKIYPNPAINTSDIVVEYEYSQKDGPVRIELYDTKENLLYGYDKQDSQIGINKHLIPYTALPTTEHFDFVHIIKGNEVEKKKILIEK